MKEFLKKINGWRVFGLLFGLYVAISEYSLTGIVGSIGAAILIWAIYSIGYFAAEKDRS